MSHSDPDYKSPSADLPHRRDTVRIHHPRLSHSAAWTGRARDAGPGAAFPLVIMAIGMALTVFVFAGLCFTAMRAPAGAGEYYPSREGSWMPSQTPVSGVTDR